MCFDKLEVHVEKSRNIENYQNIWKKKCQIQLRKPMNFIDI